MTTQIKKFRFSNRAIGQLPPCPANSPSKATEHSDTEVIGLRISTNKAGRKFWYWRYTHNGTKRAAKLGEFPALDVVAARKRANEMRAILDQGNDPQGVNDKLKAMPTLKEFADREYMPMARRTKRSHKDDLSRLTHHLLPRWSNTKLSEITTRDVQSFIGEVSHSHSPATANRLLSLLSRMLKLATLWSILERNPCVGIAKLRETPAKERFLSDQEIGRFWQALDADENVIAAGVLKFLLLTGMRRNEAAKARWNQVNLDNGTMYLPVTKSGKPRSIPLSLQAMEVLKSLPSYETSEWVFPGRFGDRPIDNVDKCMRRTLASSGLEKLRVHDLRHSFASLLARSGKNLFVIQSCLGHSSPIVTQRYAHLCDETIRDAHETASAVINLAIITRTGKSSVEQKQDESVALAA